MELCFNVVNQCNIYNLYTKRVDDYSINNIILHKLPQVLLVEYLDNVLTNLVHNHKAALHYHMPLVKSSHF